MIILLAGIHAVGKTFLGSPVSDRLGIRHATASQLIREELGSQTWTSDKRVSNVDDNQAALISAVNRLKRDGGTLLLDGHFVLRGEDGAFIEIADAVFRNLRIDAILLLQAEINVISERLLNRGDTSWSPSELTELAERELERAISVSLNLSIPLRKLHSPTEMAFQNEVQSLLGI